MNKLSNLWRRGSEWKQRRGKVQDPSPDPKSTPAKDSKMLNKGSPEAHTVMPEGEVSMCLTEWSDVFAEITKRRSDLKLLRSFMNALASAHDNNAKNLNKIAELPAMEIETSFKASWESMKKLIQQLSHNQSSICSKISKRVMLGILECKHQLRTEQERLTVQSSRLVNELQSLQTRHDKRKKTYFDSAEKAHMALSQERKCRAEGNQKKSEKFTRERVNKVRDARTAFQKYQASLAILQTAQRAYVSTSADILKQLEALEQMRIAVCNNQIRIFLQFREDSLELEKKLIAQLKQSMGKLDPPGDLQTFTKMYSGHFQEFKITEFQTSQHHAIVDDDNLISSPVNRSNTHSTSPKSSASSMRSLVARNLSRNQTRSRLTDSGGSKKSLLPSRARSTSPLRHRNKEIYKLAQGGGVGIESQMFDSTRGIRFRGTSDPSEPLLNPLKASTASMRRASVESFLTTRTTTGETADTKGPLPQAQREELNGDVAIVIHPFEPKQPDHLTLTLGACVQLLEAKPATDWWLGKCDDSRGLFPSAFVKRSTEIPSPQVFKILLNQGLAIKEFKGGGKEELTLAVGDLVCVTAVAQGWAIGWKSGKVDEVGIFPADVVIFGEKGSEQANCSSSTVVV